MIALSVTCRPHWQPWLLHQIAKQEHDVRPLIFDDCVKPLEWPRPFRPLVIRPEGRLKMTLGEKRQALLQVMQQQADEPFAWFDDDDWHPKERLRVGGIMLDSHDVGPDVVGYHEGLFCNVQSLQTRRLATGESVVFNGAVFAPHCAKHPFQPMNRGEDTMWLRSVLKDSTVVSSPIMQHVWMSHDGNVTGKRGSMTFEGPRFQRFDSWELEFLRKL